MFISEQIAEHKFGASLEISDKFSSRSNVFDFSVLAHNFGNFPNHTYDFEKHSAL